MIIKALRSKVSARLVAIPATDTVQAAALAFADLNIGLLVACDAEGHAVGVVSKSDLVRHMAAAGLVEAPLAAVMTGDILHCGPDDDLHAAWQGMSARRLQNMPVLDADLKPLGVLDIRDALEVLFDQEQYQEQLLENYVAGVGYR